MSIQYLQYNSINKKQWDQCIQNAPNGLIYAYSFYLDALSKNWDALVLDDYEIVMPLVWNKKYGFNYLYQPFFCASLGIFGKNINADLVNDFLNAIPKKFCYWDFYLNHGNFFTIKNFSLYERTNFVLDLNKNYETIFENIRENVKRNIRKAVQSGCTVLSDIPIDEVLKLSEYQSKKYSPIKPVDFANFKNLYSLLRSNKNAITYGVYSKNNALMASCVFFFSHNRAYYILVGNHPDGKTMGASHMLIHEFIKNNSGKSLLLDFEGSFIPSLAYFYSGFGATIEKYPGIKLNSMPFWAKWLKE